MEYSNIYFEKSINGKIIDKGNINLTYDGDEIEIQGNIGDMGVNNEDDYINDILFVPSNLSSLETELQRDFLGHKLNKNVSKIKSKKREKKKRSKKKRKNSSSKNKSKKK
tara:strand:- start:1745 stop:2074 length:330 start_codon:yes stop_codon:yes gene_type:complete